MPQDGGNLDPWVTRCRRAFADPRETLHKLLWCSTTEIQETRSCLSCQQVLIILTKKDGFNIPQTNYTCMRNKRASQYIDEVQGGIWERAGDYEEAIPYQWQSKRKRSRRDKPQLFRNTSPSLSTSKCHQPTSFVSIHTGAKVVNDFHTSLTFSDHLKLNHR